MDDRIQQLIEKVEPLKEEGIFLQGMIETYARQVKTDDENAWKAGNGLHFLNRASLDEIRQEYWKALQDDPNYFVLDNAAVQHLSPDKAEEVRKITKKRLKEAMHKNLEALDDPSSMLVISEDTNGRISGTYEPDFQEDDVVVFSGTEDIEVSFLDKEKDRFAMEFRFNREGYRPERLTLVPAECMTEYFSHHEDFKSLLSPILQEKIEAQKTFDAVWQASLPQDSLTDRQRTVQMAKIAMCQDRYYVTHQGFASAESYRSVFGGFDKLYEDTAKFLRQTTSLTNEEIGQEIQDVLGGLGGDPKKAMQGIFLDGEALEAFYKLGFREMQPVNEEDKHYMEAMEKFMLNLPIGKDGMPLPPVIPDLEHAEKEYLTERLKEGFKDYAAYLACTQAIEVSSPLEAFRVRSGDHLKEALTDTLKKLAADTVAEQGYVIWDYSMAGIQKDAVVGDTFGILLEAQPKDSPDTRRKFAVSFSSVNPPQKEGEKFPSLSAMGVAVLPVPDGMDERRVLDTARTMAAFFPDKAENPSAQQEVEKVLKAKIYQTVQTFRSLEGDNETRKRGIRHFMNTYLLDAFRARHWDDAAIRKTFQEISPLAHEEGYLDTLMALMEKEK